MWTLFSFYFFFLIRNHDFKLYSCSQLFTLYVAANCHIIQECVSAQCYLFIPLQMNISIASKTTHLANRTMVNILVNILLHTCVNICFGYLPRRRIARYRINIFNFTYYHHSLLQKICIRTSSFQQLMGIQYFIFSPKIFTLLNFTCCHCDVHLSSYNLYIIFFCKTNK